MTEAETIEQIRDHLEVAVAAGYEDVVDIREVTLDWVLYEDTEMDKSALVAAVDRLLAQVVSSHAAAQASWPQTTDCDRLTAAFAALEEQAILCDENLGWSQGDGADEMMERVARVKKDGGQVRGYAFFHAQDIERAVRGEGLMVAFGRVEGTADLRADAGIGQDVAQALRKQGLTVTWNGDAERRINVGLKWRRRRPVGEQSR